MGKLVCATRYWGQSGNDYDRLLSFLERVKEYADECIVAVNVECDATGAMEKLETRAQSESCRVTVIGIQPWGKVTKALNEILAVTSRRDDVEYILFQSPEVVASKKVVEGLLTRMDPDTLVAGLGLTQPRPNTDKDEVNLAGDTSPYNTVRCHFTA